MRKRIQFNVNAPVLNRRVTPAPSRKSTRPSKSPEGAPTGRCVLLRDGRILTMDEAKRQYLEQYWAG